MFNPFKKKPFGIDDFAKLVITEARKAGITESLEYDPKSFVLKRGGQRTYLVNLFNDYCQANGGWHHDYDNSRILIPEVFGPLHLDDDPVVCLPNRNSLLVTGSENRAGIQAMRRHGEEIVRTKPRPMNPAPLILKDGEVTDFSVIDFFKNHCGTPRFCTPGGVA